MMKRRAPNALVFDNSSAMLSDPNIRARYFAATDRFEPDLDMAAGNPYLLDYVRSGAGTKPISLFRCRGEWSVRGANMYNYYRVYGWQAFKEGCLGMGLWDYCVDWNMNPWTTQENPYVMVFRHPAKRDLVHSRRYEAFREGIDDYRYLHKLRQVAQTRGWQAQTYAETVIQSAFTDITSNVTDTNRCENWRVQIAHEILQTTTCGDLMHPYPIGDFTSDCRVNLADMAVFAEHWLECTRPNGCN
jgi:hypothetical protein